MLIRAAIGYLSVTTPSNDDEYAKAKDIVDSCDGFPEILTWKQKVMLLAWRIDPQLFFKISKAAGRM